MRRSSMPLETGVRTFQSAAPEETHALGRRIGQHVLTGQVIALHGDLGAGKTSLTQGIAAGMGVTARVTSPTFTLVNEYTGRHGLRLIHIDTYRLGEAPVEAELEAATFGLEEILATAELDDPLLGAVVVIEWAERVAALLPPDHLEITLAHVATDDPGGEMLRRIECVAHGPTSAGLLAAIAEP
jgi:tRNA threonylcarbamoyladenosine biosynthesis protein TsaE